MKHLLSIDDLGADGIREVLKLAESFTEVSERQIPKVAALRGKTVATLFYENSTRTRTSFETAAKRLSADTMNVAVSTSSVAKGESLRDTALTVEAMGVDAFIVRHSSSGAPHQISRWVDASVINAGDGWHQHPTQALLDCYTIEQRLGSFANRRIVIIGDIKHSRVARSNVAAFTALGSQVTLVAPPTLLPASLEGWPIDVATDIDAALRAADVVYLLRIQRERMAEALLPSLVEIAGTVPDLDRSTMVEQVRNGVAVRMAVLYLLLGASSELRGSTADEPNRAERPASAPVQGHAGADNDAMSERLGATEAGTANV